MYIQSYNAANKSLPKSMHHFAKDLHKNSNNNALDFKPGDFCEVIHLGFVCAGSNSNIYFHALLKSLFLTRTNPIHFHILVSDESYTVLNLLFKTWQIPQVNVSLYKMHSWLDKVKWVPNSHYSGNYGLLKLIFNKVVPTNVTTKLLVLDTDLIINDDIYFLWKIFEQFNHNEAIGLAENQSPYYLGKLHQKNPWPAIGTGFNSGVMLYDLVKLNSMDWEGVWTNLTKRYTFMYGEAILGDQDIINSIIMENQRIVHKLPCFWNTQMSGASTSSECYSKYKPKIIHWNSPKKFSVSTRDGDLLRGLANSVFEFNGNWFRNYPLYCHNNSEVVSDIYSSKNKCDKFLKQPNNHYRTLLYLFKYSFSPDEWDISYVTHLSFDRVYLMETIAQIWSGPLSFTLYVTDTELVNVLKFIEESEILIGRTNILFHAVFKQGEFYPINTLRNVGLQYVQTPFSFLVDIDFVPTESLYEIIKDHIKGQGDLTKKALVVPAFELSKPNAPLPESKSQLIEAIQNNEIKQFQLDTWEEGHAATNYEKWQRMVEPYQVKWQEHYEPYIVVKSDVVQYDERFLGFGWNKVSHIMELEAQNYNFIVLPDAFIIHQPHMPSGDNKLYRKSALYRRCMKSLKNHFVYDLQKKYERNFTFALNSFKPDSSGGRKRRNIRTEVNADVDDTTDHFLVWGGPEKLERIKEHRKKFQIPTKSKKEEIDYYYYYYESEHPYNLTLMKAKPPVQLKEVNFKSSEEHNYEYDQEDLEFKRIHDSTTTLSSIVDNLTIVAEADLVEKEKEI